jgi:membrane protein DedA with SNARE-associated domain
MYISLSVLSALAWATAIGTAGYFFGVTIEAILKDIKQYERLIILGIAVIGLSIWGVKFIRNKIVAKK